VTASEDLRFSANVARRLSSELAEYGLVHAEAASDGRETLAPEDELLVEFDRRVHDADLRTASRSRFVARHYADAVEAGVKVLNECVRARTRRSEDGDSLMTIAFSPNGALLRINRGKSKSDESEQRGHMFLCQGVIGAWRNPRAHSLIDDSPSRALMMLETIDDLITTTKDATRTRKRRP
jgi:uncharacterized protein (TIGR02391 family)